MKLIANIRVKGERLEYWHVPTSGLHVLWKSGGGGSVKSTVPGHIVNHLTPYRDESREVRELIAWLMR